MEKATNPSQERASTLAYRKWSWGSVKKASVVSCREGGGASGYDAMDNFNGEFLFVDFDFFSLAVGCKNHLMPLTSLCFVSAIKRLKRNKKRFTPLTFNRSSFESTQDSDCSSHVTALFLKLLYATDISSCGKFLCVTKRGFVYAYKVC